jgi:ketopantoate hydroxymethyltransferase
MRSVLRRNSAETVVWTDRVKVVQCNIIVADLEADLLPERSFVEEVANQVAAEIAAKLLEHNKCAKVKVEGGTKFFMKIEVIVPTEDDMLDLLRAETEIARRKIA